jgi:hypothetical protein
MELWTAFIIGIAGSLHCVGMCGPIAIAISPVKNIKSQQVFGLLLYNIGRSLTYGLLGIGAGLIGRAVQLVGYQQGLSIAMGVLLLLAILLPSRFGAIITGTKIHAKLTVLLSSGWKNLMGEKSNRSLFGIGLLNGFLPCGLVYVALAGAIATGDALMGGLFMMIFGLGTLPMMLTVSLAGRLLSFGVRNKMRKLVPIAGGLLAVLFILRGLSLGIPFVSPVPNVSETGQTTVDCCPADSGNEIPKTSDTIESSK